MPRPSTLGEVLPGSSARGLRIGVLGPLQVAVDGDRVVIRSARERAVLEALALQAGGLTRVDAIVDAIWDDEPPPNARKVVQTYVARLRKLLPPNTIVSELDGYRLASTSREVLDASMFEDLVTAPTSRRSAERLREALSLWRGEPYADLADVPAVVGERARLFELRRAAEEEEIDALLAQGEHGQVVAAAEAAVTAEPLRERRWAQLMIALFRSGRQADALRAYRRCRETLVEALGVDPGPELQELEQAVLAHDQRLQRPAPAATGAASLPLMLEEVVRRPMVGRAPELAELEQRWATVVGGDRATVAIVGEAGAGKTRLAAACATSVFASGGQVLYGRCSPELAVPYQPFAEALGAPVGELHGDGEGESAGDQQRVFHEVRDRLASLAAVAPLLVVVDDLHWATPPTRRLLRYLAAAPELRGVLLLVTSRTVADAEVGDLATASRIALGALAVEEVGDLVQLRSPEDVDASTVLHDLAGGNPFLVEQLLLDRAAARRGGTAHASRAADVVAHRLHRLAEPVRSTLELAALAGPDFPVDVVVRASVLDPDSVLVALEEAEASSLIVPVGLGRFTFCHALVRSVLVESMLATRRMRFHRALATALEKGPAAVRDPAALARHFTACAPLGYAAEAVRYNREAGDIARRRAASEEAASFYGAALDALARLEAADEGVRCELLIAKGEVLRRLGDPAGQSLLDEAMAWARLHRDGRRFASVVFALNRFGLTSDVSGNDAMQRLVEEALDLLGDGEPSLRARLLAVLAAELTYLPDAPRRLEVSSNALALARQLGDDEVLARVLVGAIAAWAVPEDLEGRARKARELLLLAQRLQSDELLLRAHREIALAALDAGDLATYHAGLAAVREVTGRLHEPTFAWELGYMEAADLQLVGDLAGAERVARASYEVGRRAGVSASSLAVVLTSLLASVHLDSGRIHEVVDDVRVLGERVPSSPFHYFVPMLQLELGDRQGAAELFAQLASSGFDDIPRRQTWPLSLAMVGEAAAELGDVSASVVVHARLLPLSGRLIAGESFRYTPVDRVLGRLCLALGRLDDAARHLAAAEQQSARLAAPTMHARVVVDLARLARARGDDAEASRLAEDASAEARRHGALGVVSAAERALA